MKSSPPFGYKRGGMFQPPPQWLNVVTKMDGYIKYETPSKEFLARAAEVYK